MAGDLPTEDRVTGGPVSRGSRGSRSGGEEPGMFWHSGPDEFDCPIGLAVAILLPALLCTVGLVLLAL